MDDLQSQSMDLLIKFNKATFEPNKATFEPNLIYKKERQSICHIWTWETNKIGLTFY